MMKTDHENSVRTQRGIGLVELMVATTIGLLLLLGIGTIFFSMRQTYLLRQNLSAIQNNERMAMMFMEASIRSAGFYPSPLTTTALTQFPANGPFAIAQSLTGTTGGSGVPDTVSVRFVVDTANANTVQGCSAQLNPGHLYTDSFTVTGGNLTCTETDNTAGSPSVVVPLVAGLSGMTMVYGVDTTGGGSATQYLTAAQVSGASEWGSVKTAVPTLVFANPLAGQPGQVPTISLAQTILYMSGL